MSELLELPNIKIAAASLELLLQPFIKRLQTTTNSILATKIKDGVFIKLLQEFNANASALQQLNINNMATHFFDAASQRLLTLPLLDNFITNSLSVVILVVM